MKILFLIFFISYSLPFTAFGENKQTNIRGYVCEALHNLGSSGETLVGVVDRIGAEVLKEIYDDGAKKCLANYEHIETI